MWMILVIWNHLSSNVSLRDTFFKFMHSLSSFVN